MSTEIGVTRFWNQQKLQQSTMVNLGDTDIRRLWGTTAYENFVSLLRAGTKTSWNNSTSYYRQGTSPSQTILPKIAVSLKMQEKNQWIVWPDLSFQVRLVHGVQNNDIQFRFFRNLKWPNILTVTRFNCNNELAHLNRKKKQSTDKVVTSAWFQSRILL